MITFQDYIKKIRSNGHYSFTSEEVMNDLWLSPGAINAAVHKLKKKGELVSPARNFYILVPPEHQNMGCIPAQDLIPLLMKYWQLSYYVCLLSAADFHGVSHQKPQVFQVMVGKRIKPLSLGKLKIEFIYKNSLKDLPIIQKTVNTGYLSISSPALTMMDLLLYPLRSGGLNPTATIFSELIDLVDPVALGTLMKQSNEIAWTQRLGFILEHIDTMNEPHKNKLIQIIKKHLDKVQLLPIPLVPKLPKTKISPDPTWSVIENASIEID